MKLQAAVTSGPASVATFGEGIENALPSSTGEWMAVLRSSTAPQSQDYTFSQEDLVDRISFQNDKESIGRRLEELVTPARKAIEDAAAKLFDASAVNTSRDCEYDPETRECFIHLKLRVHAKGDPEATYAKYQQLMEVVAASRASAGFQNLDVDIIVA